MPYVNIRVTDEGVTDTQKAALIHGVTELLRQVLDKDPATTHVVIDEVPLANWGVAGLPVPRYRARDGGSS
ncbi:4-oxalocrotonate tautomerase [Krasilnikovia cinnamomea]|uniref:Tautomerase n=1 Tax=Krasilnikovia cinnamomea TaxID=349313 RepID=A0A4Q7ZTH5_9ACTN|nr:4-oxalocrotonate tautomerase family protein [Krasilnikovia cinnamomea]RZU53835.1 4-oxalocrotonate tautomerase [Krasilnikovia cinnamomea]